MTHKFKTIKYKSSGEDVLVLQAMLRGLGILGVDNKALDIDGYCGNNTVHAINTFQSMARAYGYECGTNGKNDSSFGDKCWKYLLGE